jgi:hypothetical protein
MERKQNKKNNGFLAKFISGMTKLRLPIYKSTIAKKETKLAQQRGITDRMGKAEKTSPLRNTGIRIITRLSLVLFFILCAGLYIATLKGAPGNPKNAQEIAGLSTATEAFEQSAERARFSHTFALVENGSFSLSKELADAVYADIGYIDGRYYSYFAPGTALIAAPFYIIGKYFNLAQVFTFYTISLFALGSLFFLYRICKDIFRLSTAN